MSDPAPAPADRVTDAEAATIRASEDAIEDGRLQIARLQLDQSARESEYRRYIRDLHRTYSVPPGMMISTDGLIVNRPQPAR